MKSPVPGPSGNTNIVYCTSVPNVESVIIPAKFADRVIAEMRVTRRIPMVLRKMNNMNLTNTNTMMNRMKIWKKLLKVRSTLRSRR